MARGYREALKIPAFATDAKAITAATVTAILPHSPKIISAAEATGVKS